MGLKCSLFGHAFDERDTVRERESKGNEIVTVVKDVERCTECDATRVISTNKEVVSAPGATADGGVSSGPELRTPGAAGDDSFETPADLEAGAGAATGPDASPDGAAEEGGFGGFVDRSDAEGATDGPADDGGVELLDAGTESSGADASTAGPAATEATGPEADAGATGPAADAGATDPVDSEAPAADEAAAPETDDAEILTDESEPDRAPGQWPGDEANEAWEPRPLTGDEVEEADADEADAEPTDTGTEGETPDTEAEPAPDIEPEPAATASFTVPEGHYRCPECGHTIPAESSFRRGDACPECVHGYLQASE